MAQNVHIEHIDDTFANVYANLDLSQIAILTDQNEEFVWMNDDASKLYFAAAQKYYDGSYTYMNADFAQVECHDDLLLDEYIKHSGDTDTLIRFETDKITLQAGSGDYIVIEPTKIYTTTPFGWETDSPSGDLHLYKGSAAEVLLKISNATAGLLSTDGLDIGIDGSANAFFKNRENTSLTLYTNNTERITLLNNGNVGINESSPETIVEISAAEAYLTLQNVTNESGVGLRETQIRGKGHQSDTTEYELGRIEFSQSDIGNGEDKSGRIVLHTYGNGSLNPWIYLIDTGRLGLGGESTPVTMIELTDSAPYFTLHNNTHEDVDWGRESRIIARGEQSGGEESILGMLEISHYGSSDDENGRVTIKVNDGNDGVSPTNRLIINSFGRVAIGDAIDPSYLLHLLSSATPDIIFHNTTHSDNDGWRKSIIQYRGEKGDGTEHTLVSLAGSHFGSGDDEKGKFVISTNDGNDSESPSESLTIDSDGGQKRRYNVFEYTETCTGSMSYTLDYDMNATNTYGSLTVVVGGRKTMAGPSYTHATCYDIHRFELENNVLNVSKVSLDIGSNVKTTLTAIGSGDQLRITAEEEPNGGTQYDYDVFIRFVVYGTTSITKV